MKTKFLAVLLAIGLITPSLCAQRALRGLKNAGKAVRSLERGAYNIVKTPRIDIKVPSLPTRVRAAVRGQTPALKRLQSIRTYQAYKGSVKQWRERNVSLAEELDFRGVIVTSLPNDGKMVDAFSADGKTWYAADEMLVSAVKDGRFVRFDEASGEVWFSPYKDGPEFEFYDEQLFQELDRSRKLGARLLANKENDALYEYMLPENLPNVKIFEGDPSLFVLEGKVPARPWSETHFSRSPAAFISREKLEEGTLEEITRLNDVLARLSELEKKVAQWNEHFNLKVVYSPEKDMILVEDYRGMLYAPEDFKAVLELCIFRREKLFK